jgi:hypothetical protein
MATTEATATSEVRRASANVALSGTTFSSTTISTSGSTTRRQARWREVADGGDATARNKPGQTQEGEAARLPARVSALAAPVPLRDRVHVFPRASACGLEMVEPLFMRFIVDHVLLARCAEHRRAIHALHFTG